jgi:single-strand DNA-binding protein
MINVKHVVLVGRLTKDIELRKTNSGASVCSFTVAIDRRFQSQQQGGQTADFISCIAWRQSADFLANYAAKGTIVSVEGRIQTRSYDGQNGKVYVTEVVADNVQIISSRNGNNAYASTGSQSAYAPQNQTFTPAADTGYGSSMDDDFSNTPSLDISSDDLPFY